MLTGGRTSRERAEHAELGADPGPLDDRQPHGPDLGGGVGIAALARGRQASRPRLEELRVVYKEVIR
ncbi:hypothetical protein CO666_09565 [Rhizobium chutanense]|uniref:Uncharacterized protein n=1 Tax=Rhizobium chutanense TaxID=2035448 RepID=A0A2A6JD95_9HYPH|nr:hypothetical protein CO666_09565 [Rhizobium chutanense]